MNQKEVIVLESLGDQVNLCKGDNEKKSALIEKYTPFIYNTVYQKAGVDDDDLLQVARLAFSEAVDSYSQQKGNFISFAEMVINNRINDELRKRYRKQDEILMEESEDENLLHNEAIRDYENMIKVQNRRDEINEYFMELLKWGFNVEALEDYCPKHKDTREICKFAAFILNENRDLKDQILKNKHLPVKRLADATMLKARFIEKHSRYITMLFVALHGSFYVIREYIGGVTYGRE